MPELAVEVQKIDEIMKLVRAIGDVVIEKLLRLKIRIKSVI
jgi:hypothetical protein